MLLRENAHAFYARVVKPLRRLQRRGVVERLQEITGANDRTPIAVEIIGELDVSKVSKRELPGVLFHAHQLISVAGRRLPAVFLEPRVPSIPAASMKRM